MRKVLSAVVMSALIGVLAGRAEASTFVWKDVANDYTISFPDTWRIQTEDEPSTRLRVAAPVAEDMATCRMQVEPDGRLKIYPKRLVDEAVTETFDRSFWEREIAHFENAEMTGFYAPASISGKGDATATAFSFNQDVGGGSKVAMYGIMLGGIYGDNRYVLSCSAKRDAYEKWVDLFASVMDSVEFEDKYHPFATGYYRAFLNDPKLVLPRSKPGTVSTRSDIFFVPYNE